MGRGDGRLGWAKGQSADLNTVILKPTKDRGSTALSRVHRSANYSTASAHATRRPAIKASPERISSTATA